MAFRLFSVFVFATAAFVSVRPAEACSCARWDAPYDAALLKFDAIFEGTIDSITLGSRPFPPGVDARGLEESVHVVTLKDVTAWRGAAQPVVITHWHSAGCGYSFQVGHRYLITATWRDGDLRVSYCGLTRPLDVAQELIETLKRLPPP